MKSDDGKLQFKDKTLCSKKNLLFFLVLTKYNKFTNFKLHDISDMVFLLLHVFISLLTELIYWYNLVSHVIDVASADPESSSVRYQ